MACDTVSLYRQNNCRSSDSTVSRLDVELSLTVEYIVVLVGTSIERLSCCVLFAYQQVL